MRLTRLTFASLTCQLCITGCQINAKTILTNEKFFMSTKQNKKNEIIISTVDSARVESMFFVSSREEYRWYTWIHTRTICCSLAIEEIVFEPRITSVLFLSDVRVNFNIMTYSSNDNGDSDNVRIDSNIVSILFIRSLLLFFFLFFSFFFVFLACFVFVFFAYVTFIARCRVTSAVYFETRLFIIAASLLAYVEQRSIPLIFHRHEHAFSFANE
jgi:hypothetical protein